MKKCIVLSSILFVALISLNGQNLIGYSDQEIRKYMLENEKSLDYQSFVNNSTFKYLKYADSEGTITVLFFLNEQMICKSIRQVCDKSVRAQKIKELNTKFKKIGDNQWIDAKNDKNYLIVLKDEDYSFNVTITLKE